MDQLPAFEDTQPTADTRPQPASSLPAFEDTKPIEESSTLGAYGEGVAQGVLTPLITTPVEKALSDFGFSSFSPENIAKRQEEHPIAHGLGVGTGFAGSVLSGVGAGEALASAGVAGAEALGLTGTQLAAEALGAKGVATAGKIGAQVIKAAIEGSGLQTGEEINKQMLGIGDPNAPVASALSNIGAAGLFSGGIGGGLGALGMGTSKGLKAIANTQKGQALGQFLEDFGSRWKFNQENPNKIESVYNELSQFFNSNADTMDGVYGPKGIKAQAIEKLVPPMNDNIAAQDEKISNMLMSKVQQMVADPESYPKRLTNKLIEESNNWMKTATDPAATSNDVFNATQELKQSMQAYSKFDKAVGPLSPEKDFINLAKDIQHQLVKHLENTDVWGEAGELQQGINKAFSQFLPAQKDFLSKFTSKIQGEPIVDPIKIRTYVNQLGKSGADISEELRPQILKNYIDAAEKYRSSISDIHGKLGLDSPISPTPLSTIKGTYGDVPSGAEFADWLHGPAVANLTGHVGGALAGGMLGHIADIPGGEAVGAVIGNSLSNKLVPLLEKVLGRPIKGTAIPAALRVLESMRPTAIGEALEHAGNVEKGNSAMEAGINSIFTGSKIAGQQFVNDNPDKIKKIKEFIEKGGVTEQIQNSLNEQNKQKQNVQGFAHGGEVKPQNNTPSTMASNKLSEVYPDHSMMMETAKGRVYNYLNSIRPQSNPMKLPFDEDHVSDAQKKTYDTALNIAHKPLSILPEIQKGTVTAEHVKHMTQMWPEVHAELAKKMTERLSHAQMNGEKPPYHVRQGLSLFLGAPLDSTMTPASMQAVQAVFMNKKIAAQNTAQPVTKNKKNTSKLGETNNLYQTSTQAAEARQLGGYKK